MFKPEGFFKICQTYPIFFNKNRITGRLKRNWRSAIPPLNLRFPINLSLIISPYIPDHLYQVESKGVVQAMTAGYMAAG
jgi:hypothetical protein